MSRESAGGVARARGAHDVIVALSTSPSPSARAVIRATGTGVLELIAPRLAGPLGATAGFATAAASFDLGGDALPVRITLFRGPASFTGEDLVEVDMPGSLPLVARVLRSLLTRPPGRQEEEAGGDAARLASPGEFTLRAFANGKLELGQVEALARLLHAGGEAEARAAYRQIGGALRERVEGIADGILDVLALAESGIDFPDEEIPEVAPAALARRIDALRTRVDTVLADTALRIPDRGTVRVALLGFPNAGKSSLLNAVAGSAVALVSDRAGTTRDPLRAVTEVGERRIEWVDLAGIERAADEYRPAPAGEDPAAAPLRETIERLSRRELETADVVLWLADAAAIVAAVEGDPLNDAVPAAMIGDRPAVPGRGEAGTAAPSRRLLVLTKCDLLDRDARARLAGRLGERAASAAMISSRTGEGLSALLERLVAAVDERPRSAPAADATLLVSPRQEARLVACRDALERAREALLGGPGLELAGLELAAVDLRDAAAELAPISGRDLSEHVLDAIFSQFCIGK